MKTLNNEGDLGNAYSDWLILRQDDKILRFGQYIYNEYNIECGNSYNARSELDAYNLLSEYLYQKGLEDESK